MNLEKLEQEIFPRGWISSFAESEYYSMLSDIQALKASNLSINVELSLNIG